MNKMNFTNKTTSGSKPTTHFHPFSPPTHRGWPKLRRMSLAKLWISLPTEVVIAHHSLTFWKNHIFSRIFRKWMRISIASKALFCWGSVFWITLYNFCVSSMWLNPQRKLHESTGNSTRMEETLYQLAKRYVHLESWGIDHVQINDHKLIQTYVQKFWPELKWWGRSTSRQGLFGDSLLKVYIYSLTKFRKKKNILSCGFERPTCILIQIHWSISIIFHFKKPRKNMAVFHHPVPCILQVPCRSRVLRHAGNTQQLMLTEPTGTPMLQPPRDVWSFKVCWIFWVQT